MRHAFLAQWTYRRAAARGRHASRSEEHTSELQSRFDLVCRLLLEKKKKQQLQVTSARQVIAFTNHGTATRIIRSVARTGINLGDGRTSCCIGRTSVNGGRTISACA